MHQGIVLKLQSNYHIFTIIIFCLSVASITKNKHTSQIIILPFFLQTYQSNNKSPLYLHIIMVILGVTLCHRQLTIE